MVPTDGLHDGKHEATGLNSCFLLDPKMFRDMARLTFPLMIGEEPTYFKHWGQTWEESGVTGEGWRNIWLVPGSWDLFNSGLAMGMGSAHLSNHDDSAHPCDNDALSICHLGYPPCEQSLLPANSAISATTTVNDLAGHCRPAIKQCRA